MYCRNCGKENKEGQNYCKYCGERLIQTSILEEETGTSNGSAVESEPIEYTPTVLCSACHKENRVGQKFCKFCGSSLTPEENDVDETISSDESIDEEDYDFQYEDYEESLDELSNRAKKKSRSEKQRKQGGTTNRVLITLIISLAVVLAVLVVILVSFFKTGSFNPLSLFRNKAESITEEDLEDVTVDDTENAEASEAFEHSEADNKTSETEEKQEEEPEEVDVFAEFLAGNVSAVVADDFLCSIEWTEEMKPGQEYSFDDIKNYVLNDEQFSEYNEFSKYSFENPSARYTLLSVHGRNMYALNITHIDDVKAVSLYETYVLYDNGGRLEIKFAVDESSFGTGATTRGGWVYTNGVVDYGAHEGAGEVQYSKLYAPDSNFSYKLISNIESRLPEAAFFNSIENGMPIDPLNLTMVEAAEGNEIARYIMYSMEEIDGDVYYYFLNWDEEGLTQDTVDYIDAIAASHGFGFDGKAAADAAREAYERELGVYEACQNKAFPEWIEIE